MRAIRVASLNRAGLNRAAANSFPHFLFLKYVQFQLWNFNYFTTVGIPKVGNISWGGVMRSPAKFKEYAEQCQQLAKRAGNEGDRAALLKIAEAWLACAAEAERKLSDNGAAERT
jgi:hypothetical protein